MHRPRGQQQNTQTAGYKHPNGAITNTQAITNTTTRGNNKTPKRLPATIPATHRPEKTEQQNKLTKHAIDRIPYPFKNILFYISCDEFLFKIYKWGANMSMRFFL
jgi:hypothetical protein